MSSDEKARSTLHRLDSIVDTLKSEVSDLSDAEARARRVVELMAIALQCSLLLRHGDPAVAEVFCASRLGDAGHQFGTLRPNPALSGIIERSLPPVGGR